MRRVVATLVAAFAWTSTAAAADDGACAVAAALAQTDVGLPRVASAIHKTQRLDIAAMGTGSSILAGPGGTDLAYPARLQAVLSKRLNGVEVKVASYAKPRQLAADMVKELRKLLTGAKPALVIWQTGTADAIRGIDPDEFRQALDEGVGALQAAGVDIILMNMQYSPRTESMIAIHTYAENMRWVAQQHDMPLFDRFAIMKHWSELGTFDLSAASPNIETAARVHDCIGQLLADVIVEGAKISRAQNRPIQ